MKMRSWLVAFLYTFCVITAQAGSLIAIGQSSNLAILDTKTADSCEPTLTEHFSRYSIYQLSPYQTGHHVLIEQQFDVGRGCFEGYSPAKVSVSAKHLDAKFGGVDKKELWSFTTEGISGDVLGSVLHGVYRVDMPGCCSAAKTSKFFSLETGRLIGSTTSERLSSAPLLKVDFVDRYDSQGVVEARFISAEDNIASTPQTPTKAIGTIFLANRLSVVETISILGEGQLGTEEWWLSEFNLDKENYPEELSKEVMSLSGKDMAKIHIKLKCRCDAKPLDITIPLTINGLNEKSSIINGSAEISLVRTVSPSP
ncbi:MAG: hypothetical protein HY306_02650 [Nitrosomonadales bacterium]|nr:hypothetical protein [Nitrosomonadales bacterium]